jgi:hypothetical protein
LISRGQVSAGSVWGQRERRGPWSLRKSSACSLEDRGTFATALAPRATCRDQAPKRAAGEDSSLVFAPWLFVLCNGSAAKRAVVCNCRIQSGRCCCLAFPSSTRVETSPTRLCLLSSAVSTLKQPSCLRSSGVNYPPWLNAYCLSDGPMTISH